LRFGSGQNFRVLDVGCGRGDLVYRIAQFFPKAECIGIDANAPSIARALEVTRENLRFIVGGFERIVDEGKFDAVICSEVIEHVMSFDTLLDAITAVMRPGGILSISTPSGWMYRLPRAYNVYKLLQSPRRFYRLYLKPEQNWQEALEIHPALLPSKLRRMVELRGFTKLSRQASLWWLLDRGPVYCCLQTLENWGWRASGLFAIHLVKFLDSLMNVVPLFRVFETRSIFLFEKNEA
jgi:2-polyprenyl-3-methyl-5-hydroxy-6-metoxy-1,4-benzoquinol methylase